MAAFNSLREIVRNKIIELISYHGGTKRERIYDDAKLEKDLGVTGDDLWELLEDMDKEFEIDWKETDFSYFFYPECAGFIWSAMNKERVKSIKAHPVTVNHLVLVAQRGEWFTPESQN